MMDVMVPGGLLGWGLIAWDRHERLLAEARGERLARAARADRPSSRRRISVRRVVAWRAGTGTGEGIDR